MGKAHSPANAAIKKKMKYNAFHKEPLWLMLIFKRRWAGLATVEFKLFELKSRLNRRLSGFFTRPANMNLAQPAARPTIIRFLNGAVQAMRNRLRLWGEDYAPL
jgi:hypothetical protein